MTLVSAKSSTVLPNFLCILFQFVFFMPHYLAGWLIVGLFGVPAKLVN